MNNMRESGILREDCDVLHFEHTNHHIHGANLCTSNSEAHNVWWWCENFVGELVSLLEYNFSPFQSQRDHAPVMGAGRSTSKSAESHSHISPYCPNPYCLEK